MGQSSGVLLKEVAAFGRCPLIEVSLCMEILLEIYVQPVCIYIRTSVDQ